MYFGESTNLCTEVQALVQRQETDRRKSVLALLNLEKLGVVFEEEKKRREYRSTESVESFPCSTLEQAALLLAIMACIESPDVRS